MRKLFLLTLAVIIGSSLILGCSKGKGEGGTIVGKVNNTFHGGGVEGAKVILISDESELATTDTDSSGNFTFSGLSPGRYGVTVTKEGFFDNKTGGIEVEKGKETLVDIGMIVAFGGT